MHTRARRTPAPARSLIAAAAAALPVAPALAQPAITAINAGTPTGVSNGGTVVGGDSGNTGFRWTAQTGMTPLTTLASRANGVSADGLTIAGHYHSSAQPFRWTAQDGAVLLPLAPGEFAGSAHAISTNGQFIAGSSGNVAARWHGTNPPTTFPGSLPAGYFASGRGVSDSGNTVVGWYGTGSAGHFSGQAFRWTSAGGFAPLPSLAGASYSEPFALSADGAVAVGFSGSRTAHQSPSTQGQAVRWVGGAIHPLGPWTQGVYSAGLSTNADGSIIVGEARTASSFTAFIWTQATGMVPLSDYLPTLGVNLQGWTLYSANAISPDGTAIAGTGAFNGQPRIWLVTNIPAPGTAAALLPLTLLAARRRRP